MDILVINPDLMERSVIKQVLEHSDHKVTFVPSIREAWKMIVEGGFRFAILDASSEEQSIHQFIQHVRSNPNLPGHVYILLLINRGQTGRLVSSLGIGADDYLNKPVAPQELKSRVAVGVRILSMADTLLQARDQLDNLAMYDSLTSMMNREAFYKIAQGELERARRASDGVSVIALNLDNFKGITGEYGQAIGNNVLQIVAQIIREKCRPYDCVGRWDDGQFTIVLPGIVSSDAEKIAKRIISGVQAAEITLPRGPALGIKLNAGIASSQTINAYAEIDTFIQNALIAMNNSKQTKGEQLSVVYV